MLVEPAWGVLEAQHAREKAGEILRDWDFPQHQLVRRLADGIAKECLKKSLEPNASLGGGASAFGIPQDEFDEIPRKHPALARVLQFGVAYNSFMLVPNHGTKKKVWCLVELGGTLLLRYILILWLALTLTTNVSSQRPQGPGGNFQPIKISGIVHDASTDSPLEFTTVSVFSQRDSSLIVGGLTDANGVFSIERRPGKLFLW